MSSPEEIARLLRLMSPTDYFRIGSMPPAAVKHWASMAVLDVVITGERRTHYLARHPELEQIEAEVVLAVLEPSEIWQSGQNPRTTVLYRVLDPDHLMVVIVAISEDPSLDNSVISAHLIGARKQRKHAQKNWLVWRKEEGSRPVGLPVPTSS